MLRKRASIKGIGGSIFYDATGQNDTGSRAGQLPAQPATDEPAPHGKQANSQLLPERPHLRILPLSGDAQATTGVRTPAPEPKPAPTRATPVPPVMRVTVSAPAPAQASSQAEAPARKEPIPLRAQPPAATAAPVKPNSAPPIVVQAPRPAPVPAAQAPAQTPGPDGTLPPQPSKGAVDLKAGSPEQEKQATERLGDGPPKAMLEDITALYQRVTEVSGARMELAEWAMDLLSEARDLLLLGTAGDYNQAERKVNEAKLILNRIEQSRSWSNTYGWALLLYELGLFVAFVAAIIFDRSIAAWLTRLAGDPGFGEAVVAMSGIFPPWNTMLWGGIGGLVGALYSLHWHVAELQDFDRQYSLWYIVQPFMGLILGGIIHLVIVTGMLALVPVTGAINEAQMTSTAVHWFPSLVACLAGFRQKFAYELLDNIMKAIGRQPVESSARTSA